MSWTALYGQTGSTDTLTCYTNQELKRIAIKVVYANECDTVLAIAEKQLIYKDSVITSLDSIISIKSNMLATQDSVILLKDTIINVKSQDLDLMIQEVKETNRRLKWAKVGWLGTTAGMFVLLVAALLK